MASPLRDLTTLRPINLDDFNKAVAIYRANSSDEKISTDCMDYFVRHLLISYNKESGLNYRVSIDLNTGTKEKLSAYEPAVITIQTLGIDLSKAFEAHATQNPLKNRLEERRRESSIKTILENLKPISV